MFGAQTRPSAHQAALPEGALQGSALSEGTLRRGALKASAAQATALLAALLALCAGLGFLAPVVAYSALLGGLIAIVPQAWFAHRVFRGPGARSARQLAHSGYAAETGRFVLTAAGFGVVFATVRPLSAGAVFAAFGAMTVIQLLGAWALLRAATPGPR